MSDSYYSAKAFIPYLINFFYAVFWFFFMKFISPLMSGGDLNPALALAIMVFASGVSIFFRDLALERFDLGSPLNKEKKKSDSLSSTINELEKQISKLNKDVLDKDAIIQSIVSSLSNVFVSGDKDKEMLEKIRVHVSFFNKSPIINNKVKPITEDDKFGDLFVLLCGSGES